MVPASAGYSTRQQEPWYECTWQGFVLLPDTSAYLSPDRCIFQTLLKGGSCLHVSVCPFSGGGLQREGESHHLQQSLLISKALCVELFPDLLAWAS